MESLDTLAARFRWDALARHLLVVGCMGSFVGQRLEDSDGPLLREWRQEAASLSRCEHKSGRAGLPTLLPGRSSQFNLRRDGS